MRIVKKLFLHGSFFQKALYVSVGIGLSGVLALPASGQADTKTLFFISNTHLDTQWNWDVKTTINEYVKNTMRQNFSLMDKYANFNLNYEGAIKYQWMKEYYPDDYARLKQYIAAGKWHVSGCGVDACDVMVSSAESIMRNWLYGHVFYEQEFGVRGGYDIMLPDCFGFPYSLPSLARHCGMKGFHTAKLSWGSAQYGQLAPWGVWQGVDGSQIYAIYKPHAYDSHEDYNKDMSSDTDMENTIADNYSKYGLAAEVRYVGPRSDHGGGLKDEAGSTGENTPYWLDYSVQGAGPVKVEMSTPDDIFDYMDLYRNDKYQIYDGELPMRVHGVGAYTSQSVFKLYNRKNELLADAAEKASSMAYWLAAGSYPTEELREAWTRNIWQAHHDGITGTSIPKANFYSKNEYVIANKMFANAFRTAVGATARLLDTQVTGVPVVVYNPLSQYRTDVVEAEIEVASEPAGVRVYNKDGEEVLSQVNAYDASTGRVSIIFAATVPSLGYAVYDVQFGEPSTLTSSVQIDAATLKLENANYSITINEQGDMSGLTHKADNKKILGSMQWQLLEDNSTTWPAWEITWESDNGTPFAIVDEEVEVSVEENGPLRKGFRISRSKNGSRYVHHVRMNALNDRVECVNEVDWQTRNTMLKVLFPLFRLSASKVTYDLSLGTLQRGVSTSSLYEMQGHQWADLTSNTGSYGVSVLNDCKYGWDMPEDGNLRLTLIHTPFTDGNYSYQAMQDLGVNKFTYALYPHKGTWNQNTQIQAAELNQPLVAFTAPKHDGGLGRAFPFVELNTDKVAIKALKKAEMGDELIVRVYEWTGESQQDVKLTFPAEITSAREVNGLEEPLGEVAYTGRELSFSIGRYQPRTFAVRLAALAEAPSATLDTPVELDYNADIMSYNTNRGDATSSIAYAYPAELISDVLTADGVTFAMGDRTDGKNNALRCGGQTLKLDRQDGQDKLYVLAVCTDKNGAVAGFKAGAADYAYTIPYYGGNIGQIESQFTNETVYRKDDVALTATHCHQVASAADVTYEFLYIYKYMIPLADGVDEVILPDDGSLYVLAATLSDNEADDVKALTAVNTYLDYTELGGDTDGCGKYLVPTKITASCYANSSEKGDFAADNNAATKWCAKDTQSKTPWLEYDYPEPVEVCKWMVLNAGCEQTGYISKAFKLQYYDNGSWKDADEVSDNTENKVVRGMSEPIKASRFRLQMVQGEQNGYTTRIYEFALYGKNDNTTGIGSTETVDGNYPIRLMGNYPNPFRESTTVQCELPDGMQKVYVEVFDLMGKKVSDRPFQTKGQGLCSFTWTPDIPAGLYLYRVSSRKEGRILYSNTKRLVIQ
ncbi:MAG: glycoside hydrolase family 38 C-terminal domain-containing protein [Prevotella sp.]